MTDYRYQVFVSSTYRDLSVQRRQIAEAIQRKGCYAAGMELFPASDQGAWDHIDRVMKQSDLYLLISAGRYGSQQEGTEQSFTEREYELSLELAKSNGLRHAVLVWDRDRGVNYLDQIDSENSADYQKQRAFQERVTNDMEGSVGYFFDDASIINETHAALDEFLRKAGPGWVRADKSPLHEELVALHQETRLLNIRLEEAEQRIKSLRRVAALPTDLAELECSLHFTKPRCQPYKSQDIAKLSWSDLFSEIGAALDSNLPVHLSAVRASICKLAKKQFNQNSKGWTLQRADVDDDNIRKMVNHLLRNRWIKTIRMEKTGLHYTLTTLGREAFLENETFTAPSNLDVSSQ